MNRNANDADDASSRKSRRQRDHRAGAGRDPVDGRDHRQRALAQGLHHRAGHPGELEQLRGRHLLQLADDLLDVAAGAEPAALPGEHDHLRVAAVRQLGQEVAQVGVDVEGERVQLVRPGERDRRDPVVDGEVEVLPGIREAGRSPKRTHVCIPPPSRTIVWPLMAPASGAARNATANATSSGSSSRPSGDSRAIDASLSSSDLPGPLGDPPDRARGHVGAHERRAHRVRGDAGAGELGRDRPHETDRRVLGRRVPGGVGRAEVAGRRGDGDDPAAVALAHAGQHRAGAQERAGRVDVQLRRASRPAWSGARGALVETPALFTSTSTSPSEPSTAATASSSVTSQVGAAERHDLVAGVGEPPGDRRADPLGAAGDHDAAAHGRARSARRSSLPLLGARQLGRRTRSRADACARTAARPRTRAAPPRRRGRPVAQHARTPASAPARPTRARPRRTRRRPGGRSGSARSRPAPPRSRRPSAGRRRGRGR